MIKGASIVCFSLIDWTFNRQQPQVAADAFAQAGNRVLFVENTGVRIPTLRDAPRLWSRARNWMKSQGRPRASPGGVDVLSPVLLPFPYSRMAIQSNSRVLLGAIRRWLGDAPGPLIVITFVPTPLARSVIHALGADLLVYYCIDLISESSPAARQVRGSEGALLREADLVLVTSKVLHQMAAPAARRLELLECGVDTELFVRARQAPVDASSPLARIPGPRLGFVGSLRKATDLDLVARAAELAPDLQWVLAGPQFVDVGRLKRLRNVHIFDTIPHDDVARYLAHFDAGILPYVLDSFTAAIMPAKAKEYLAAGLPIVATSLPEMKLFAERHPGVVEFADTPEEFVAAARTLLATDTPARVADRIAVSRRYDWSTQTATMVRLIDEALAANPARPNRGRVPKARP